MGFDIQKLTVKQRAERVDPHDEEIQKACSFSLNTQALARILASGDYDRLFLEE